MKSFKIDRATLLGANLIEAGAGTGKTHTIAGLFLRLIVEQGLAIDRILVVTYTKAAAGELKSRIRQCLCETKTLFQDPTYNGQGSPFDPGQGVDPLLARRRIQDALIDFDRAAIYTIHGFCQRLLHTYAFETGHPFDTELVQDIHPLVQETADDFWRRHITTAPIELATYAIQKLHGPENLAGMLKLFPLGDVRIVPDLSKPALRAILPWRTFVGHVLIQWPKAKAEVERLLLSPALNAKIYGSCETPDKTGSGTPTPRRICVSGLADAMTQWDGGYPTFKGFERFSALQITKATKKRFSPPQHPFFDLCQAVCDAYARMEIQLESYVRYLKVKFLHGARRILQTKKQALNQVHFDDLLTRVHQVLRGERAEFLIRAIQAQYQAALVDEFQDTDPLQYHIFSNLFSDPKQSLFLIGDPKQAIYGFRGADLFSYLQAKREVSRHYTLTHNWRATPALIHAVNTIFSGHPHPFGLDHIRFEPAVPARSHANAPGPALRLWYLTPSAGEDDSKPFTRQEAVKRIAAAVTREIVTLLDDPAEKWLPEQIAVLVRTHHQARLLKATLSECRVPAVLHSAGRVFDTLEAGELLMVLRAAAEPTNHRHLRAALATRLLGASAQELNDSLENRSDAWRARCAAFDRYHRIWRRYGFFHMFSRMLTNERIKPRLLASPDGERRLTDLLHLAELIQRAASTNALGSDGIVKWLAEQSATDTGGEEDQKLRLESDARAVRIITIHKSKGLQFDVVFCPFTWSGAQTDDDLLFLHDPWQDHIATLAVGPGVDSALQTQALKEALAENVRLFYVALTRAKFRCYLAWGRIQRTAISAPAYLLHGADIPAQGGPAALESHMLALSNAQMMAQLTQLSHRSGGSISLIPISVSEHRQRALSPPEGICLAERVFNGRIDLSWRVASYSALIAATDAQAIELPDHDSHARQPITPDARFNDLNHFPTGARAGLFFHDLLERWDLSKNDIRQREQMVRERLSAHNYDLQWTDAVSAMLHHLAAAPLSSASGVLRLGEVPARQCVKEMEFYYPLKRFTVDQLRDLIYRHGVRLGEQRLETYLKKLAFGPMHGFMKGYMDLVLRHDGRYYLIDWKSNYLGEQPQDYCGDRLNLEMASAFYFLQYHLYVTALDRLLRARMTDYTYVSHFGGVFYIFLRGMRSNDLHSGIFYARPDVKLVTALRHLLIDG